MPRDVADLAKQLTRATEDGFRDRLRARGQAQSMIRREGILPEGSPSFSAYLDQDLLDYGYSMMSTALRILEAYSSHPEPADLDGFEGRRVTETFNDDESINDQLASSRNAFLQASYALEAATRNADPDTPELEFHRLIAGAASHMAGYAARAFSLVEASRISGRLSPMELTLADLLMRDLSSIEERALRVRLAPESSDESLTAALTLDDEHEEVDSDDNEDYLGEQEYSSGAPTDPESLSNLGPITILLSEHYLSSVSAALFAIAFGRSELMTTALADLRLGEDACNDISAPGPWWVFRLYRHIVSDLDATSILRNIPSDPPGSGTSGASIEASMNMETTDGGATMPWPTLSDRASRFAPKSSVAPDAGSLWEHLRNTYVAVLMSRDRAEIDLWPSQLHIVERIFKNTRDLVVSLPTGAGKTRIAELCILQCLAQKRRAVFVTPLRALSAQTERIMEETFAPLGIRVSSLYGSMGANELDGDALRESDIVISTPEKLDFAIRSEPNLLDDVGLVILDEGHMIGVEEREVRYEAQIQRLLRRADANSRRIVCLSAVFPENDQLTDFVNWITEDDPGGLHMENWRPTRQQFGLVEWRKDGYARLTATLGEDKTFIPRYFEEVPPTGRRKNPFPQNQNEMTLATAWRLVEEGQTVLIYCPLKSSVGTLASLIVTLHRQGLIESIMPEGVDISNAVAIGAEWFGANHDILKCLQLGVAIHHGSLPGPFRREMEALLHQKFLKVTIASPTLAQGLNLSASAVLFSSLYRHKELLKGAEFANVIGRAGRAYVDTEGLVLCPIFEPYDQVMAQRKRANWNKLTTGARTRDLKSGLITIGMMMLKRMHTAAGSPNVSAFVTYVTGSINWSLPEIVGEDPAETDSAAATWAANIARLDTALLSVIGDEDASDAEIIQVLADAMHESLWERQLHRQGEHTRTLLRAIVEQRAQYLWNSSTRLQRRGWYLAGLGAGSGSELARVAPTIVEFTIAAEVHLMTGAAKEATRQIVALAEQVFTISTFEPKAKVGDWRALLAKWLAGEPLSEMNEEQMTVAEFIESDIVYRLVWGIEAARVFEQAQGNVEAELVNGAATAALESGTLNRPAAILLRSGFDHRSAAVKAVIDTDADFIDASGMRNWVISLDAALATNPDWPTKASRSSWEEFVRRLWTLDRRRWKLHAFSVQNVDWNEVPNAGDWLRVTKKTSGTAVLWSPGFEQLGTVDLALSQQSGGVHYAVYDSEGVLHLCHRGPDDWLASGVASQG